jgi:hypothetical protein
MRGHVLREDRKRFRIQKLPGGPGRSEMDILGDEREVQMCQV